MKIVIIEDELLTAKDLKRTILSIAPDAEILCILQTVEESILYFESNPSVDLIFSDIQLGDGISFECFNKVSIATPIIFCTAFNDYAFQAFDISGIDYILKPFSKKAIEKAITKFKNITQQHTPAVNLNEIYSNLAKQLQTNKLPNVIVQQADKIIPIPGDEIALFYIENGIVKAVSFEKKQWVLSQKLDELESKFQPSFFRANRQFLVNRKAVKEAHQHFNRKLLLQLNFAHDAQILIGKEKVTPFLEWLANH